MFSNSMCLRLMEIYDKGASKCKCAKFCGDYENVIKNWENVFFCFEQMAFEHFAEISLK